MVLTTQELEVIMPDATQLYSNEPEMESSLNSLYATAAPHTRILLFSPDSLEFEGFKLVGQEIASNEQEWHYSEELGLSPEAAIQKRQGKEIAQRCAERLVEQLRLLGIPAAD